MKSVLVSEKPIMCDKIANGKKTIIVKKKAPKEVPFKAYIYCTNGEYSPTNCGKKSISDCLILNRNVVNGKVIGEFICDKVVKTCGWRLYGDTQQCAKRTTAEEAFPKLACLTIDEIVKYAGSENREVCGWHISDLKIYDKPRELSEFGKVGFGHEVPLKRPCAPWCYVEDLKEKK
jgi:hypothetical protein